MAERDDLTKVDLWFMGEGALTPEEEEQIDLDYGTEAMEAEYYDWIVGNRP